MRVHLLIAMLAGVSMVSKAMATNHKVVLMGGQSNMDGRAAASALSPTLKAPQPDVKFFYDDIPSNNLSNFTIPSAWTSLAPMSNGGSSFGPEITFGRAMADANPTQHYALIKYARGGTTLAADWKPGTGESSLTGAGVDYTNFRNSVSTALNLLTSSGDTYQIAGMLWLQGESDPNDQAAYYNELKAFVANMRGYYGANLPFIIGGMANFTPSSYPAISAAQQQVATDVANVRYFDNSTLSGWSAGHFDLGGQMILGQRFATSLQSVSVPEPATLGLLLSGGFLLTRRDRKPAKCRMPALP